MEKIPLHDLLAEIMRREQKAGQLVLDREMWIGGLRRIPGAYQLAYLGPVTQPEYEPELDL